jgi:hypothetical protein
MKPLGLVSQILSIGLAVLITVFYTKPEFTEISQIQSQIKNYNLERQRADDTNQKLAMLVSKMESVPVSDRTRLATYMPQILDEVSVLRDIQFIVSDAGVTYKTLKYNGIVADNSEKARLSQDETNTNIEPHEFTVSVDGEYDQLKDFFSMLEQNKYPLQVYKLSLTASDENESGGYLAAEASLVTYTTEVDTETEIENSQYE